MKKKLFAILMVLCFMMSMSVYAFADEVDAPKGTDGAAKASTGEAVLTGASADTMTVVGDDDDDAATDVSSQADINVWVKVLDQSTPTYKVDIEWGSMKFQFDSKAAIWNTETHTYTPTGTPEWTVDTYLDAINNAVTVTNHSNAAVNASFNYTMETGAFNADAMGEDAVVGNFFASNTDALAAALVLAETGTAVVNKLTDIDLHTAYTYYASAEDKAAGETALTAAFGGGNEVATGRQNTVYFAFSGTPDAGKGVTLSDFTKVGVITVTINEKADLTGFEY